MKRFLLLTSILLTGCATLVDEPTQEIYFDLANDINVTARCMFETPHQRVQFDAPGYAKVQRSRFDAVVYCNTTNGDSIEKQIATSVNDTSKWNILNAGAGFVEDVFEETAWSYPSIITIDFEAVTAAVNETPPPLSYEQTVEQDLYGLNGRIAQQTRQGLGGHASRISTTTPVGGSLPKSKGSPSNYVDPFAKSNSNAQ
ncbi:MAG: hypothetical protein CMH30_07325 [Micavibrio sp.]|nr:hypothetical protein [Micavibrio sp.]|tara:strand:+ start:3446 stop:4045 length:600 start_codon:yes stop_codon:yes gene_type:complete